MSHTALARKWRPQQFEAVVGQKGVVETLRNAISTGRLAQAFIFAGPRGVGKTTTARILARALNCVEGPTPEPCGRCDACREIADGRDVDVMEIDGATYTGIDAVREVIVEPLAIAPMRDRYKIFIIDEVHRLSKNAFDALLKSIEEPPPYVKFLMATTELHAVPVTIQSRSQVFELKALPLAVIRAQLEAVTDQEQVAIDDAALLILARSAEGSMRDALSALDQVLAFTSDRVTAADVGTVLGLIGRDLQLEIAETVAREDLAGAFDLAGRVADGGYDLRIVCRELARLMRDLMVIRIDAKRLADAEIAAEGERERVQTLAEASSAEDLMRAFDLLSRAEYEIRQSSQPRHQFEMTLMKWIHLRHLTPLADLIAGLGAGSAGPRPAAAAPPRAVSPPPRPAPPPSRPASAAPSRPAPAAPPRGKKAGGGPTASPEPDRTPAPGGDLKAAVLASIREENKVFFGMVIAQAQKVEVEGDTLAFTFAPVHRALRTQLEGKRAWIERLAQAASGRTIAVVVREGAPVAGSDPRPDDAAARKKADLTARAKAEPTVQAVLDVFGGDIEDVEEIT